MQWLKRHLTEIFCVLFLTLMVGVVVVRNYTPGTFLTGIDNFHIEFDLRLALSRAWSGLWQENQGLGIVSGLAQMTELPRLAIYQLLSWMIPMNLIRYAYIFGNLYLGVIGIFFLTFYLSKSRLAGLAGALLYLFNLGTLQVFFMPTDMFVANYAALPWFFLLVFKYLSEGRRSSLWWYAGLILFFAPMAMTPTIFVVYLLFLGIICAGYLLSKEIIKVKWRRVVGIVGVTLGMSMYILLPFANFALNNADVLTKSKVNTMFSQENYLMNASRTSWEDLATLTGMWFDYPDNIDGQLVPLLGVWDSYLASVGMWIYLPMFVIGIGIVAILWKKRWQGVVIVGIGAISTVLLRGENPPIGELVGWLRSLPLIAEAFRTPYTKIAPILTMVYAVCFGYGAYVLGQIWRFKFGKIIWKGVLVGGVASGLIWLNLPYFHGKLVSEGVRVKMPVEYFEMFMYLSAQDKSSRIVKLPSHSSQAWDYTNWGYRGSGFLWYGIEQPILDRAFDVWSPYNEGFYNEFSTALYGGDEKVSQVLNKYDVRYVLLDESVIAPGQGKEILRVEETKRMAEELGWEQKFKEGFLTVWEVNNSQITNDKSPNGEQWISTPKAYTLAEGEVVKAREDVIYEDNHSYVSGMGGVQYPFANLMKENPTSSTTSLGAGKLEDVEWGEGVVRIKNNELRTNEVQELSIPGWKVGEIVRVDFATSSATTLGTQWEPLPAYYVNDQPGPVFLGEEKPGDGKSYFYSRVSEGEEWEEYRREQKFEIRSQKLEIEVRGESFEYDFAQQGQGSIGNCDVLKRGVATKTENTYFADERGAVCDYVVMEDPFTRVPHLLRLRGENIEGRSIKFFLYNTGSKRNDIEYLLGKGKFDQTFSLIPWDWDGYYTLNIETRSFGERARNRIEPVVGMYVPLEKIAEAKIANEQNSDRPVVNNANITHVKKTGTWLYGLGVKGDGLIRLSQGYDEGWVAWIIGNSKSEIRKLEHVKVDGWSNGWIVKVDPPPPTASEGRGGWANGFVIDKDSRITNSTNQIVVIFYWPQLLQYLGFVVLGITVFLLVLPVNTKSK